MSEVQEQKPKTFASKLKDALEHGKNASTAIVLVLSVLMGVYNFFAPEREARTAYSTLKPVVEQSANEIRELRIRLDYAEKMMLMKCSSGGRGPASVTEEPAVEKSTMKPEDLLNSFLKIQGTSGGVQLPDAPWEKKSAF